MGPGTMLCHLCDGCTVAESDGDLDLDGPLGAVAQRF
jgi:hypothetical protein